jgi:hypothetical protein
MRGESQTRTIRYLYEHLIHSGLKTKQEQSFRGKGRPALASGARGVGGGSDPRHSIGGCRPERHLSFRHVCCGMAFPIPPHLPKKQPTDVSSAILGRISDADSKSLNAALAESWITELDESIRAAKVGLCLRHVLFDHSTRSQQHIRERIQRDLPAFNSQLAAAESIRSRLQALKNNTDRLSDAISNPEVCPHSLFWGRWGSRPCCL